ncbi:MAG: T9SS type A sorting domain-containing protein [Ignavibacterium sp.]
MKIKKIMLAVTVFQLLPLQILHSQYQMPYGVTGSGGGKVSSTNNTIVYTVGEAITGKISSSTNIAVMGFWNVYQKDVLTSVEDEELLPVEFKLEQNYPNPFNPSTRIRFVIPNEVRNLKDFSSQAPRNDKTLVTLIVYDVLGNEVATLVNEEKPAGRYEVEFNAGHLATGIYLCRMQAGNYVSIKKMMLLK